ncbi:hypothetical protein [Rhizobium sp. AG207R]|uniref:hypothetical protein n=1 Tax=Rhizobium sp. AG207R TaxID=2802287 RepID=UPI0022AC6F5D|nr:hypothetical protein [Rhizobium sp. AG207R]MCZ3375474.1 hypothetical protein [Rhizobium sp. AG207R]
MKTAGRRFEKQLGDWPNWKMDRCGSRFFRKPEKLDIASIIEVMSSSASNG